MTTPDWYTTFCALAGAEIPPPHQVDGVDISAQLQGDDSFERGPIFWHLPPLFWSGW